MIKTIWLNDLNEFFYIGLHQTLICFTERCRVNDRWAILPVRKIFYFVD